MATLPEVARRNLRRLAIGEVDLNCSAVCHAITLSCCFVFDGRLRLHLILCDRAVSPIQCFTWRNVADFTRSTNVSDIVNWECQAPCD